MTQQTALSQRIAALAEETPEFTGKARVLNQTGCSIELIVDEVDQTTLAAALTFDNGNARVTLHIAGRRLHMICDVDGSVDDPSGVFGKPLAVEDAALRENAAALLQNFAATGNVLAVMSEASNLVDGDAPDSMSVESLRAACGIEIIEDAHLPQIERLLARSGDKISAWIRLNGNRLDSTSGSVADISGLKIALTTQLSAFEQSRRQNCASHSDPSITTFFDVSTSGQSLGIATFENETLLFAIQTVDFSHLYRAFRQIS